MGRNATLFLAKSAGSRGVGGCPDLRRFADYSGGTVGDSHRLPRFSRLNIVERQSMSQATRCQLGALGDRLRSDGVLFVGFFRPVDIIDPPAAGMSNQRKSRAVSSFIGAPKMDLERDARTGFRQLSSPQHFAVKHSPVRDDQFVP